MIWYKEYEKRQECEPARSWHAQTKDREGERAALSVKTDTCDPRMVKSSELAGSRKSATEGSAWCAREISLRAQKKFLSRVGGAASARSLVLDEHAAKLLDQFLTVLRERVEKKEAEKLVKHVIKAAVKLGVLRRHGQLTSADERALGAFRSKFHTVLMAVISFCEVDFSYDRGFLQDALRESHQSLKSVVERHLSDKSVSRLAGVFNLVSRGDLLDSLFAGQVDEDVLKLTRMLRQELDRGLL